MKIFTFIESSNNKINPVSLEALVAAQQLKKDTNGEVHAIIFNKNIVESLSKFEIELNTQFPIGKLYCEFCQSKKERKIIKELCKSVADSLDFYDFEEDLTRGGKLK